MLCCAVLCCAGLRCAVLCCAVLCCAVLCRAVLYSTIVLPLYATGLASYAGCCNVITMTPHSGDLLGGRERTFKSWLLQVVQGMLDRVSHYVVDVPCLSTVHMVHPSPIAAPDPTIAIRGLCLDALCPASSSPKILYCQSGFSVPSQLYRSGSVFLPGLATSGCTAHHVLSHVTSVGLHSSSVSNILVQSAHKQCCDACMYMERQRCLSTSCSTSSLLQLGRHVLHVLLQVTWHPASI